MLDRNVSARLISVGWIESASDCNFRKSYDDDFAQFSHRFSSFSRKFSHIRELLMAASRTRGLQADQLTCVFNYQLFSCFRNALRAPGGSGGLPLHNVQSINWVHFIVFRHINYFRGRRVIYVHLEWRKLGCVHYGNSTCAAALSSSRGKLWFFQKAYE